MNTTITPLEYVQKEFKELENMSQNDWLRKMQEFAVLQNSKINLEHILEMTYSKDRSILYALNSAVQSLYLADSKDYKNGLFAVVRHLAKIDIEDINNETIKSIYHLLNPAN